MNEKKRNLKYEIFFRSNWFTTYELISIWFIILFTLPTNFFFFVIYVLLALFIVTLPMFFSKKTNPFSKEFSSFEKIPTEFNNIYKNLYQNKIRTLESMRKQLMWKRTLQFVAFTVLLIIIVAVELNSSLKLMAFIGLVLILFGTIKV